MHPLPADVRIAPWDPATADAATWAAYHAFRRARYAESRPDDPVPPDADAEIWLRQPEVGGASRRWLAWRDGAIVGAMGLGWVAEGPMFESNRHLVGGSGAVLRPHRRQGIGLALARRVLAELEAQDRRTWTSQTIEDDGRAFLAWLGAVPKMEASENRLDLTRVDWDMVDRWAAEGPSRSPSTTLEFWPDRVPVEAYERYAPALSQLFDTMPFDDLDHGQTVFTPELLADYQARIDRMNGHWHTMITREPDGTISGVTDVSYTPGQPDRIIQQFTGVHPDHRGRGLGKWLKAAMLRAAHARHPDARWVVTGNANSNDPMLAINRALGFTAHRGETVFQLDRDALRARLAEVDRGAPDAAPAAPGSGDGRP